MIRSKNVLFITFALLILTLLPSIPARAEENYTFEVTAEDDDVAMFSKESVSSTKVMLIVTPIIILAVIFIACVSKGNGVASKSYPDLAEESEEDTSLFGIDWDGDGETSMADDFLTMEMLDDDFL